MSHAKLTTKESIIYKILITITAIYGIALVYALLTHLLPTLIYLGVQGVIMAVIMTYWVNHAATWKTILKNTTIKATSNELMKTDQIKTTSWKKELAILSNRDNIAWIGTFKIFSECVNYIKADDYLQCVSVENMQLYQITDIDELLLIVY